MAVQAVPGFNLQPSASQVPLSTNYITNFDFLNQYLPDTYEKEFERYGNRTVASFLRMVGAEMPSNSDLIKWAEQGRLHTKYVDCTTAIAAGVATATFTVNDTLIPANQAAGQASQIAVRVGQTVFITDNAGGTNNKAIVTAVAVGANTFTVAFYEGAGFTNAAVANKYTNFIYGSEFAKGTEGMVGSLEAQDEIFENSPIILKDKYAVSGSDMAQIGWIEITTENGASGSEGVFYVVNLRGNVWGGGFPVGLADFDTIVSRLDKQGSIEENVIFVDRNFSFSIDDMLAAQNSYGAGGSSYGLFENDKDMALNLGFTGFRRGYDFYKSDWKYLNDPTMRGGLPTAAGSGKVSGLLVPAGSTTVYDQILGKNAKRPFLHVRYRASETEDRRYKTWITGSAGGAETSDLDAMEVNFLSERAVCTLGANNFFLFQN
jgi:hypothetical protein